MLNLSKLSRAPEISLWDLLKYYSVMGVTRELIVKVVRHKPLFPLKFLLKVIREAIRGELFMKRPNNLTFLSGLPVEDGLLLVNLRSLQEAISLISSPEFRTYGFIGFSYCQLPELFTGPQRGEWGEVRRVNVDELRDSQRALTAPLADRLMELLELTEVDVFVLTTTLSALHVVLDRLERGADEIPFIGFTCPMMAKLVYELADIIGLRGIIAPLERGVCASMIAFHLAEMGGRRGRTYLSADTTQGMIKLLDSVLSRLALAQEVMLSESSSSGSRRTCCLG